MSRRSQALDIVRSVVPSVWGSAAFTRIVGNMYHAGGGTTCGFLPSYMLFQMGCRDARIVNRNEGGLAYKNGDNVSRLVNGAKALDAWRTGAAGIRPGDIYFISNGPPATEHVGVYVSGGSVWRTADAGQDGPNGEATQNAAFVQRPFDGSALRRADDQEDDPRTVQGYIDIDALPYTMDAPADLSIFWVGAALAALWWIW